MNISQLFSCLTVEEKQQLQYLLNQDRQPKGDRLLMVWADEIHEAGKMSPRLYSAIKSGILTLLGPDVLLSELCENDFKRVRNAGPKTWNEFVNLKNVPQC